MPDNITIQKNPILPAGMDYGLLRRTAMQYIEQLGSDLWTDYNIHDPGITIMEALCYALTDLSFRANFNIEDLLAEQPSIKPNPDRQAFFTARNILTVSPWTCLDYRKLLVDIDGIKNGWVSCKQCACEDLYLYANCKKSILQYAVTDHQVIIKGLYDVMIEFEDEDGIGDLNSGRIKYNFAFPIGSGLQQTFAKAILELRMPAWHDLELNKIKYKSFRSPNSKVKSVQVLFISGNETDNQDIQQKDLGTALRKPLFATIVISFWPDAANTAFVQTLSLGDIPLLVWFNSDSDRKALLLADLAKPITDASAAGIASLWLNRIHEADRVMKLTRQQLHANRNLCEDFCTITSVQVQDVAVCADMDVSPDADIEQVLGQAYFLIAEYMSPDIRFYSLQERLDSGLTVDTIFDGPRLNNGFIDDDQIATTNLKTELHTSDIINLLMDIPGVLAIRNFVFSPFDNKGNRLSPESWVYKVPAQNQPRLYLEGSKFLVFKNNLPFLPDLSELSDTLQVIRGQNAQPKYPLADDDIPVPAGIYSELDSYTPIQYELPQTYGVSPYGLAPHENVARRGQAMQLKAYLMFYEQILVDYLSMLRHTKDFFALDNGITQTYFAKVLGEADITGITDIYATVNGNSIGMDSIATLIETPTTFLDRRNRFLDHLMARFAEQFTDYTLMLYSYLGNKQRADAVLIQDKIDFLVQYPEMSRTRGRSFNYKLAGGVCSPDNLAGLQMRIARLLGFKGIDDYWELYEEHDTDGVSFERRWRIRDTNGKILLSSSTRYTDPSLQVAEAKAKAEIALVQQYMTDPARYVIKKSKQWVLNLTQPDGSVIATRKQHFSKKTDAEAARDYLVAFAQNILFGEKIYIVEHLLLRPHNRPGSPAAANGDQLLPICIGPICAELCHKDDPYSFRMTLVMNGKGGLANAGIAYRRFAERTIRFEIPAHIGLKICWISTDQMITFDGLWCSYLSELNKVEPDPAILSQKLGALLDEFNVLKSEYPPASLHDCADGNDENRVFLNQTVV